MVEAECLPAANVEVEARSRLGLEVESSGRVIETAIALRYPQEVGEAHDLRTTVASSRLSYCVYTEREGTESRFLESGWLGASVEDSETISKPARHHVVASAKTEIQRILIGKRCSCSSSALGLFRGDVTSLVSS